MSSIPYFSIYPVTEEMRADPYFSTFCSEAERVFEDEIAEEKTYDFVKNFMENNFSDGIEIVNKCGQYTKWVDEIGEKSPIPDTARVDDAFYDAILQQLSQLDKIAALKQSLSRADQLQRINRLFEVFGEAPEKNSEMKEKLAYLQSLPYEERVEAAAKELYG